MGDVERESPQQRNRRLFPGMAEFVDDMRRVFGPDVKVREVHNDTGDKVGSTLEEIGQIQGYWTADQWLHMAVRPEDTKVVMERAKADQERAEKLVRGTSKKRKAKR